jgi:acyl dehydratase
MIYFEDVEIGGTREFGPLTVDADAVVEFARKYDPQPFHLSDEGARDTYFGKLAASGWHTAALTMKLMVGGSHEPLASLGSPGFDDLRWRRPVYPGDTLRVRLRCMEKTPSRSRPEMGSARFMVETLNQDDEVVMSFISIAMIACRTPRATSV